MIRMNSRGPLTLVALAALALAGLAGCGVPPDAPAGEPSSTEEAGKVEADDEVEDDDEAAVMGDAVAGQAEFKTCAGCHGPDGQGIPNLGKDLHANAFLADMTDDQAVAFLKVGRPSSDPLNTTGVAMPPKGGNPAFSDDDLYDIVAYVRTLK